MKTAAALVQMIALSACLLISMDVTVEHMAGVRRALQTMEGSSAHAAANGAEAALAANSPLKDKQILYRA